MGITIDHISQIAATNPSFRGMLLGYTAELKLKELISCVPGVFNITKQNDHDRSKKGDFHINYLGHDLYIELKSIRTDTAVCKDGIWTGKAQVDASDKRQITLPNGQKFATTLLLRGGFDILSVNCFAFGNEWKFSFILGSDLPYPSSKKYGEISTFLLAGMINVTWPAIGKYVDDLRCILNRAIMEKTIDMQSENKTLYIDNFIARNGK